MVDPATTAAMERLRTCPPTSDQAVTTNTETRRLTMVLPVHVIEALRRQCQPGESLNERAKRAVLEAVPWCKNQT